jgi:dynein heavy chain, axonemal
VSEFNIKYDDWMYGPFAKLDATLLEESVTEWLKKMGKLAKSLPREDLKGVAESLRSKLDEFRGCLGIVACICNPGMRSRHWAAVSELAGIKVRARCVVGLQRSSRLL